MAKLKHLHRAAAYLADGALDDAEDRVGTLPDDLQGDAIEEITEAVKAWAERDPEGRSDYESDRLDGQIAAILSRHEARVRREEARTHG